MERLGLFFTNFDSLINNRMKIFQNGKIFQYNNLVDKVSKFRKFHKYLKNGNIAE